MFKKTGTPEDGTRTRNQSETKKTNATKLYRQEPIYQTKLIISCCSALHLLISASTTPATNQIRNEHYQNESTQCCTNNDGHKIADGDGAVIFAVHFCKIASNWQ